MLNKKSGALLSTVCVAVLLTGCGNAKDANKDNFKKAIQDYLDTQPGLCAAVPSRELPFTLADQGLWSSSGKERADALAEIGFLEKKPTQVKAAFGNKMESATEYQLTSEGEKALNEHRFCTGQYQVIEVDNFTEPGDMMGVTISEAKYRYRIKDAADWANNEALQAAYKEFAEAGQAEVKSKAVLILTGDGWLHERLYQD